MLNMLLAILSSAPKLALDNALIDISLSLYGFFNNIIILSNSCSFKFPSRIYSLAPIALNASAFFSDDLQKQLVMESK